MTQWPNVQYLQGMGLLNFVLNSFWFLIFKLLHKLQQNEN